MSLLKIIPLWAWALIAMALACGYLVVSLDMVKAQRDYAAEQLKQADAREESIRHTLGIQRELYADTQKVNDEYSNRLNAAESESSRLAANLRNGGKRLSVNATCVPGAGSSSSAIKRNDATAPRLTDSAQQGYLDLRAGIQRQRAQIEGLQTYITTVCLKQR